MKALSESVTHVEVGQEDSFMCTCVHDCENLICHLPCSYPPGNLSINKSQTEQRNILLSFNSPLFKKMLLYMPYAMLSHDCRRLFSIKYSQANNKSQYIMCLKKIFVTLMEANCFHHLPSLPTF